MLSNEKMIRLIENMKHNTYFGMRMCYEAQNMVFSRDKDKTLKSVALLNQACHYFGLAKTIYFNYYEELFHPDIDEVFAKFDTFVNEITNNIVTNHSHQWTEIEYRELANAYMYSSLKDKTNFNFLND